VNFLVLVLSSQLLYYLLIAQTGVVGAFDSHIYDLYTLPIGGVIGTLLSAYWKHRWIKVELYFLFVIQIIISWFYPDYSLEMLLVLGFVVGYTTPLLLYLFGAQSHFKLALGLAISYVVGTALYTTPFSMRGDIALLLPLISVVALLLTRLSAVESPVKGNLDWRIVVMMMVWIFADSALFETLSRSGSMDIWSHYTLLILSSHVLGVYLAYRYKKSFTSQGWVIWVLFIFSYMLYYLHYSLALAIVYPVVISYYNVLLFRTLVEIRDVRLIALAMVGVGWIATSVANAVALTHQLWVVVAVLTLFGFVYPFYFRRVV